MAAHKSDTYSAGDRSTGSSRLKVMEAPRRYLPFLFKSSQAVNLFYRYSPLKKAENIRLLTLLPGEFSADIRILIHKTRLTVDKKNPVFEALSYT